jgi:hypothetical protein
MTGIAKALQQGQTALLRQGFAPGDADVVHPEGGHALAQGVHGLALAAVERISRVAIAAAQGATGQAHEYRRHPGRLALALQRAKHLGDAHPLASGQVGALSGGRIHRRCGY